MIIQKQLNQEKKFSFHFKPVSKILSSRDNSKPLHLGYLIQFKLKKIVIQTKLTSKAAFYLLAN